MRGTGCTKSNMSGGQVGGRVDEVEGPPLGWRVASHYGILQTMTNIRLPSSLGGD